MNLLRSTFSLASPSGNNGRLSIFIFHRVLPQPDLLFPDEPDAKRFDELMGWINSWFNVLPLDDAIFQLREQSLPARAAAITFDDGYADNFIVALPILLKHKIPATFFIATGFLDGGRMWNDTIIESLRTCTKQVLDLNSIGLGKVSLGSGQEKSQAIGAIISKVKYRSTMERIEITDKIASFANAVPPNDLMMTTHQVRKMRKAGMQIGAHTVSHPILASIDLAEARNEMAESKFFLENLLGERVSLFAYPNGKPGVDFLAEHVSLAQELGFDAAVSTAKGSVRSGADLYQLPRFTPWDRTKFRFWGRLLQNLLH